MSVRYEPIDISLPIRAGALAYPGDEPLAMEPVCRIGPDSPVNLTRLHWTTHFLTHIDPPAHFFAGGATLDELGLERFIGEALVVAVAGDRVRPEDLPPRAAIEGRNLLFKTRNSTLYRLPEYQADHVYITPEAAGAIAAAGANMVGIDYLSVDRYGDEAYPVHRILLGQGVLILEGLNLEQVAPGHYELHALPLRIMGGDGSPVRAVLLPAAPGAGIL